MQNKFNHCEILKSCRHCTDKMKIMKYKIICIYESKRITNTFIKYFLNKISNIESDIDIGY